MSKIILDASALLALLRDEPGADDVAGIIDRARMSAVNHAEIVSHYAKLGIARADIEAMLAPLPIDIVPADTALATEAGMLRPLTIDAGLSLGDRFCLALARQEGLPVWTADRSWKSIAEAICVEVLLIR